MLILDLMLVGVYYLMRNIFIAMKAVPEYFMRNWHDMFCDMVMALGMNSTGLAMALLVCSKYPWELCPRVACVGIFTAACCGIAFASVETKSWADMPKEFLIIACVSYLPFIGQMLFAAII